MTEIDKFNDEKQRNISEQGHRSDLIQLGVDFITKTAELKYSYNFTWMGRPIIAFPQDMIIMQEIIWDVKPDLIIETGVAHGGSIVYYASLMKLFGIEGKVLGIDIDIRTHNRVEIEKHPMYSNILLYQGSSVAESTIEYVERIAKNYKKVLVCLDSNHTHDHVLQELKLYSDYVSKSSYIVVFDTVIEDMPSDWKWNNRLWHKGNNPKTAVNQFLSENSNFVNETYFQNKALITVAPNGFLKRIS